MTSPQNIWLKDWFIKVRQLLGGCQICDSFSDLEFAHLKYTPILDARRYNGGRGRQQRYSDIVHYPDSYTILCDSCHRDFDSGRTTIVPKSLVQIQLEKRVMIFHA